MGHHDDDSKCRDMFLCRSKECKGGASADHHYLSVPEGRLSLSMKVELTVREGKKGSRLTVEQEEFLSELSSEMAERCMKAFTNRARMERSKEGKLGLLEEMDFRASCYYELKEVTTNAGQRIGTLIDLASDTNYITHEAANRLKLRGEEINLVVHGVGKMAVR